MVDEPLVFQALAPWWLLSEVGDKGKASFNDRRVRARGQE